MSMVEVKGLTKYYGDKLGAKDVSFSIEEGELVGLLGPNGAGKSTIMKMVTGYLMPTSGSIRIKGIDVVENPQAAAALIGFLPEQPPLYMDMTVEEYLLFVAGIKGVKKAERWAMATRVMETVSIAEVKGRIIKNLSKGYRQRVGLAQALMGKSELLILDEPTVGLDPKQIAEVRALLVELKKTHTIILSSHILSEINMICEKIIIINRGRIVAQDTTKNIEEGNLAGERYLLKLRADKTAAHAVISSVEGIRSAQEDGEAAGEGNCAFVIACQSQETRVRLFEALAKAGMPILELSKKTSTLEQAFLRLTEENE